MERKVLKRDGTEVPYDFGKIADAVNHAFNDCGAKEAPEEFIKYLEKDFDKCTDIRPLTIEEIQDRVEIALMIEGHYEVAKYYIKYRNRHASMRFIKERVAYIDKYRSSLENAATSSETDPNANVHLRNVANQKGEAYKTTNRELQRYVMTRQLKKQFPEVAENYCKDLESKILYQHDEASSPVVMPYCKAVTTYPFMQHGTSQLDGIQAGPPTNLISFAGQFCNMLFLNSAQTKGAVAYGDFFVLLAYYCVKDLGADFYNHLDEFIYLGPKMRHLLRTTGKWANSVKDLRSTDFGSAELNAIRDEIAREATKEADGKTVEGIYREWSGSGRPDIIKLGDGTRTVESYLNQVLQFITYTMNQPCGNRDSQSPFTNISYFDSNYYKAMFGEYMYPDCTRPSWPVIDFLQKHYMKWFNRERTKTMLTFPVETMAMLTNGKDVIDQDYKNFTAEMYAEGHSFFTYLSDNPNALASCCRLRNGITDNVFSFTNGLTGVQTGSANVMTLNLNRITQNWARENGYGREYLKEHFFDHKDSFCQYLTAILERVYKYQTAYKTMLYEVEKAGLLTDFSAQYMSVTRLYSTIGENGINEAAEFVGLKCNYNPQYRDFCRLVTGTISENNRSHSTDRFMFNQEFVPAESLGAKNYDWDKQDGYWVPEGRNLYNSYFYLADDPETTVIDKFKLHGREFTGLLDGGVGLHVNLEEHLSKEQYLNLIDVAIKNGTSYFTFNIPNSECTNRDCHYIVKLPMDKCPKCGAPMDQHTRVIGYMVKIKHMANPRQEEASRRYYAHKEGADIENE